MSVIELEGDLLETDTDIIIHQCNVTTFSAGGLAGVIFRKFPKVNTYTTFVRTHRHGHVDFFEVEEEPFRYIGNVYSQYHPGQASHMPKTKDTAEDRLNVLGDCLQELKRFMEMKKIKRLALPYLYGCGLAGGNWPDYLAIFEKFAEDNDYEVKIVSLA